ncbi:CinA family protein [Frigoribacterium sp. PhB24]|uniref:CinA family protein n=1 Tax=Frigoribacterium sp. PhB24 TaxID=2485204 RepID=UPI000F463B60|nr:nicotinamide-nucleotide amidohydrolase family protein [Frigoribacterium sp. PhB24]ROS48538.1 nicotinamide-nucleotide amidase [Frigoribacterium sp. PhB24]
MTLAADVVAELTYRRLTIAVAESLTGGALVSELVSVPGASAVVRGGVVAYQTELKHTLLGVDAGLLARHGPVHRDVATSMATGVRDRLAVDGQAADIGLATTGVAGPDPQGGHEPGTVFVGLAVPGEVRVVELSLSGDRRAIRNGTVSESLAMLGRWLAETRE